MGKLIKSLKYKFARFCATRPNAIRGSKIDKKARVSGKSQVVESEIGKYSYVSGSRVIYTKIESFCSIADGCVIGGAAHPMEWVSSSPVFYSKKNIFKKCFAEKEFEEYRETQIGNDVWIGSNCLIKAGVKIGDGAVIGMGSVVTKDVPPYEVWAGNPAKKIKIRFDEKTIDTLLEMKWWDWTDERLKEYAPLFDAPEKMIEKWKNEK